MLFFYLSITRSIDIRVHRAGSQLKTATTYLSNLHRLRRHGQFYIRLIFRLVSIPQNDCGRGLLAPLPRHRLVVAVVAVLRPEAEPGGRPAGGRLNTATASPE